jgi:hypothetical protein
MDQNEERTSNAVTFHLAGYHQELRAKPEGFTDKERISMVTFAKQMV